MGKVKGGFFAELKKNGVEFYPGCGIKERTTFKIGGTVYCRIFAKRLDELSAAVKTAKKWGKKIFVMGSLSNVLITDKKINKVFIELGGEFYDIRKTGPSSVYAGAGAKIGSLTAFVIKNGLAGIEFMAGIPGTMGGAVYMNAGAYGKGIGAYIKKIHFMDRAGQCGIIENPEKAFSYRHSIFQENGYIVTGAELGLKKGVSAEIRKEIMLLIKTRHAKHPWKAFCAGSFFKNSPECPAGSLIERAGLKGKKVGDAMVSLKHANFLINTGNAGYGDVVKLAKNVKQTVYKKFGVKLEEEVRYIK
jgi:UDP-N-acetylmuramate dehydrogenase